VTFDNVAKSLGSRRLFAGVSFALDAHDHAVLVGRNGTGKTTLLRLIANTEHADEGRIARARGRASGSRADARTAPRQAAARLLARGLRRGAAPRSTPAPAEQQLGRLSEGSRELEAALRDYQSCSTASSSPAATATRRSSRA
jgi:ATPase subunit of ABC transporter with duplicated ATPase domains